MSGYPPDDFDRIDEAHVERAGAHRAGPNPVVAVVPLLLVALVVVAVVVGAITAVRSGQDPSAAPAGGGATSTAGSATAPQPAPSGPATTEPTATEPTATEPTTTEPTTTEPTTTEPTTSEPPDRSAALTVLNGTRTSGLAGDVAALLDDAGWDDVGTGNYREDGVPPTTVFYGPTEDLPTARLAARDLGGLPVAQDRGVAQDTVTVLVGEDYEG